MAGAMKHAVLRMVKTFSNVLLCISKGNKLCYIPA